MTIHGQQSVQPARQAEPRPGSRAERATRPRARDVLRETAVEFGVCVRPLPMRRVDLDTGEVEIKDIPCGAARAAVCPSCAARARRLRAQQERLVPLPAWAVEMLRERRSAIGVDVEPVFPSASGEWRDPSNVLRVWREVRDELQMVGMVSHTMRKAVASFLDDAQVSTRKISDQLGHAHVSMTQDRYLAAG
jgi:integrase